jgi:hypothetical protein
MQFRNFETQQLVFDMARLMLSRMDALCMTLSVMGVAGSQGAVALVQKRAHNINH